MQGVSIIRGWGIFLGRDWVLCEYVMLFWLR